MVEELSCKEVVELVTDYLEGTLPEDIRLQMERHLAGCDGCTNYLEQMRQTIRLTGALRDEGLTPQQRTELLDLFRDWNKT